MKSRQLTIQSPKAKTYQSKTFPCEFVTDDEIWIGCVGAAVVADWFRQQTEYLESNTNPGLQEEHLFSGWLQRWQACFVPDLQRQFLSNSVVAIGA